MVAGLRYGPRPRIRLDRDQYWSHLPWICTDGIYQARGMTPADAYAKWRKTYVYAARLPDFLGRLA